MSLAIGIKQPKYLKIKGTGRIYPFHPELAKREDVEPCDFTPTAVPVVAKPSKRPVAPPPVDQDVLAEDKAPAPVKSVEPKTDRMAAAREAAAKAREAKKLPQPLEDDEASEGE